MSEVEGLRRYGGVVYGSVENDVDLTNGKDEYWSEHISISRKYFDEVLSMRDEYQSMFEEFHEKFKAKMKREIGLEKELEAEKRKVKELKEANEKHEENLETFIKKVGQKEVEVETLILQKQESEQKISKLEANMKEVICENKQLQHYKEKCKYLEQCNKEAQETIAVLRIARDTYQTESKWLKKKYEGDGTVPKITSSQQNNEQHVSVNVFGYRRAKLEKELFDTRKIVVNGLHAHTTTLEKSNAQKDHEILELRTENDNVSKCFKLQQKIIDDLNAEMLKTDENKERFENTIKTLKQSNKELELKTWYMADSFDDIYRLIQEANELLIPKKCFGKFFNRRSGGQQLMKEYLKQIEEITNIYE